MEETAKQVDRSHDWANVVFGAALFGAPWLYHYAARPSGEIGLISGAVVVILAAAALWRFAEWELWAEFLLGIVISAAPLLFHFTSGLAIQVFVILGILLILSTGLKLWRLHHPVAPADLSDS